MVEQRPADILIHGGIVVTLDGAGTVFENGAVAIRDGIIVETGESPVMQAYYDAEQTLDAQGMVVMPGLVNLHFHSDNYSRGVGEHLGLEQWLDTIYYPMLGAMSPQDAYKAGMLAYAEAIKSGTTCVNDMYIKLTALADAAERIGIRAVLSSEGADLIEGQESLEDNERALLERNNSAGGRITFRFGVEWIPVCSPAYIRKCRQLADRYGVGIHVHLNESKAEVETSRKVHGKTPVELVHELGLLGPDVVAAHCVWMTDSEIDILRATGTHISHNPVSNAKLGNGIARVMDFLKAGINVGLGTDDAPCNNNNDMFEEMKCASLFQKAVHSDAGLLPSHAVLAMATRAGAKALGLDGTIGSLENGKRADVILVNLRVPSLTPVFTGEDSNVLAHLVFAAHGENVDTSIIDGRIVMRGRKLLTADEEEIITEATGAATRVIQARKRPSRTAGASS